VSSASCNQPAGQHQAPGRGVHQQRIALADVRVPVRLAELVADQQLGGAAVGDAQQRLGNAHQQHALLAREVVLAHEGLDRALLARSNPDPRHEVCGALGDAGARGRVEGRGAAQGLDGLGFIAVVPGGQIGQHRVRRRQLRGDDVFHAGQEAGAEGAPIVPCVPGPPSKLFFEGRRCPPRAGRARRRL
jgi:hypothetical protein